MNEAFLEHFLVKEHIEISITEFCTKAIHLIIILKIQSVLSLACYKSTEKWHRLMTGELVLKEGFSFYVKLQKLEVKVFSPSLPELLSIF